MIPNIKAAALVIGVLLVFVGGYKVADWRLSGQYADEKLTLANQAAEALASMTADRDRLSAALTAANDTHAAALRKAQDETNSLRDRLHVGSVRLRVAATCPASDPDPQAAGSASVDTGTGAELNPAARRAYFALRDGIDRAAAQLAACQDELRLRARQPIPSGISDLANPPQP